MKLSALALGAVLAVTVAVVASVALGVVAVAAAERLHAVLGEVEWDDGDE